MLVNTGQGNNSANSKQHEMYGLEFQIIQGQYGNGQILLIAKFIWDIELVYILTRFGQELCVEEPIIIIAPIQGSWRHTLSTERCSKSRTLSTDFKITYTHVVNSKMVTNLPVKKRR